MMRVRQKERKRVPTSLVTVPVVRVGIGRENGRVVVVEFEDESGGVC